MMKFRILNQSNEKLKQDLQQLEKKQKEIDREMSSFQDQKNE